MWPSWSFYPRTIKSVDFTSHRSPTFSYTALATTLQVVQKLHFVVHVVRLGGLSGKEVEWSICKYRLNWHEYWGVARGALITPPHRAVVFNHNIHLLLKLVVMELAWQTLIDSANAAGIIMEWTGNQSGIWILHQHSNKVGQFTCNKLMSRPLIKWWHSFDTNDESSIGLSEMKQKQHWQRNISLAIYELQSLERMKLRNESLVTSLSYNMIHVRRSKSTQDSSKICSDFLPLAPHAFCTDKCLPVKYLSYAYRV